MKFCKLVCVLLAVLLLAGCVKGNRVVHCDGCGCEIELEQDSKVTEEWIVFCKTCEVERFGPNGVVE